MIPTFQLGQFGRSFPSAAAGSTDPHFASVVRLYHCDGTDGSQSAVVDSSSYATSAVCEGSAQRDTAQFKFGTASVLFDGANDALLFDAGGDVGSEVDFASGDWTVEMFLRLNSTAGTQVIAGRQANGNGFAQWQLWFDAGKFKFRCWNAANSLTVNITGATTASTGTWYHLVGQRSGDNYTLGLDGAADGTATASGNLHTGTTDVHRIGISSDGISADFNGWIDEIRMTKGVARYTFPFTPPVAAFPDS